MGNEADKNAAVYWECRGHMTVIAAPSTQAMENQRRRHGVDDPRIYIGVIYIHT